MSEMVSVYKRNVTSSFPVAWWSMNLKVVLTFSCIVLRHRVGMAGWMLQYDNGRASSCGVCEFHSWIFMMWAGYCWFGWDVLLYNSVLCSWRVMFKIKMKFSSIALLWRYGMKVRKVNCNEFIVFEKLQPCKIELLTFRLSEPSHS